MGGHTNYHQLIYRLIVLRNEFDRVRKDRYQDLINVLRQYEIDPDSDNEHLPDHKEIARILDFKLPRACKLLKDFYKEITTDFNREPLEIKEIVHIIHIGFPYDERNQMRRRDRNHPFLEEYTWVEFRLPFTPRIGESIRLDFMQFNEFTHGYVHDVIHTIEGYEQRILIEVHPIDSEYYRWKKLETEYNWRQR